MTVMNSKSSLDNKIEKTEDNIVDKKSSDKLYTGFLLATSYASTIGGIGSMGNLRSHSFLLISIILKFITLSWNSPEYLH